jgi:hypothetical protein
MDAQPDDQDIRTLAYQLWESRGRPVGDPEADWQEAERKLLSLEVDESGRETFPASDPPSTHYPDLPPRNAPDLWLNAENAGNGSTATGAWLPSLDE